MRGRLQGGRRQRAGSLTAPETEAVEASASVTTVAAASKKAGDEIVTVEIPGAKITPQYVITPTLGKRPRWFEKKRIVSAEKTATGVRVTAKASVFYSRGLKELVG
jgi:hypothetical protein